MGGVKEAEEEGGEIGMVSHGWVSGVEGEVGWTREAIGGEENGRKVRGRNGREGKDGERGRKARERGGEGTRKETGRLIGKEEGNGGHLIFPEEEGRALQMVSCHLLGEALKGQDLLPGECKDAGRGGGEGGRKGGDGRTGEGGEMMTTRMTICWRAATQSRPTTGMRRAGGRGRPKSGLRGRRRRRRRRRGGGGGLHTTWTGITDKGEAMVDDSLSAQEALK